NEGVVAIHILDAGAFGYEGCAVACVQGPHPGRLIQQAAGWQRLGGGCVVRCQWRSFAFRRVLTLFGVTDPYGPLPMFGERNQVRQVPRVRRRACIAVVDGSGQKTAEWRRETKYRIVDRDIDRARAGSR